MNENFIATEYASLFATGERSASDIAGQHIAIIRERNLDLNAVIAERFDTAVAEAADADKRRAAGAPVHGLDGVPITIKDSLDLAGFASTFGLPSRSAIKATDDEVHVARRNANAGE